MEPPSPPILYINLDQATDRRRSIEAELARMFPGQSAERMPAVQGTVCAQNPEAAHLTPYTRFLLANHGRGQS